MPSSFVLVKQPFLFFLKKKGKEKNGEKIVLFPPQKWTIKLYRLCGLPCDNYEVQNLTQPLSTYFWAIKFNPHKIHVGHWSGFHDLHKKWIELGLTRVISIGPAKEINSYRSWIDMGLGATINKWAKN